jgi:hypothetical protein
MKPTKRKSKHSFVASRMNLVKLLFTGFLACVSVIGCAESSDTSYSESFTDSDYSTEEPEYSESDVSACGSYSASTGLLESQQAQDFYEMSILFVRASYDSRIDAWGEVFGSSNYEVSMLIYADDFNISMAASDFENAYQSGLSVVSDSTDPSEIEDVIDDFFYAFDSLNTACMYATD